MRIVGYFSIALKTLKIPIIAELSKNLRKKLGNISDNEQNIVAFLIGQLGRDSNFPKDYLDGEDILQDCYRLIGSARDIIGGRVVLLECKPAESLCKYYEDKGFIDITEDNDGLKQYIRFMD